MTNKRCEVKNCAHLTPGTLGTNCGSITKGGNNNRTIVYNVLNHKDISRNPLAYNIRNENIGKNELMITLSYQY